MNLLPVVLVSDALVFLLILVGIFAVWHISRHEHLLLPWRRVVQSETAMICLIVLSLFFLVGLLDSLHYRAKLPEQNAGEAVYSAEVLSVFDALLTPLRVNVEKTYSAPFAINLFSKESMTDASGKVFRDFPRLRYGGASLPNESTRTIDIVTRGLVGVLGGLALSGLCFGCFKPQFRTRRVVAAIFFIFSFIGMISCLAGGYHVLGTDKVGQDILYLSLKSIRTGLIIGTVTTLVTLPLAIVFGVTAGYFRGWVDDVIQYIYTVLSSIPSVLLIAAAVLIMQVTLETHPIWFDTSASRADLRLVFLCFILGVTSWTGLCRLLRGETLKLREMEYIQAAQSFGVSTSRILMRHIMPNVMHIVLISLVMDFSGLVLAEAVLSYVGVGVDPTMISFGTMINGARLEMGREPMVWWALASALFFMLVMVLAANLFADAVRDALDPRLNRTDTNNAS